MVIDGTIEYLNKFSEMGFKIGIVTNGRHEAQTAKIKHSGFSHLVDKILISESFGQSKPAPDIFVAISNDLGIDIGSSWFIGDHPINDILGSKQVGCITAWLQRNIAWPQEHDRCYNFKENDLLKLFKALEKYVSVA